MFHYDWKLADNYCVNGVEKHHSSVFSTFSCGGGSTMGYKLAGYDVIGANDIDKKLKKIYIANHHPKFYFDCKIKEMLDMNLPKELYELDVLDGSPPCSSFSLAGSRDKFWGKKKMFAEGQEEQVLDTLFFDLIDLTDKLKPKIIVAENVLGIILGKAVGYIKKIISEYNKIGYDVQVFKFDASAMGVPQRRTRIFVIGRRKELGLKNIKLNFNQKQIPFKDIDDGILPEGKFKHLPTNKRKQLWSMVKPGNHFCALFPGRNSYFNHCKVHPNMPIYTLCATKDLHYHYLQERYLTENEIRKAGTFPEDYNFCGLNPTYIIGMSVPPVMMANIAHQIYLQWIKELKHE